MFAEEIKKSLVEILPGVEVSLEHPADFINGDYSSNIAMLLSAKLKAPARLASLACKRLAMSGRQREAGRQSAEPKLKTKNFENDNPKEIAEKIVSKWQESGLPDFVEKVEVAGPGFINIWLSIATISNQLSTLLEEGMDYGRALPADGGAGKCAKTKGGKVLAGFSPHQKAMVIDYSSPNIAKPFGIGHLRSTNIGQAIYNLYKFLGWKVVGDNHLGDWGTQFGKLIYQILRYKDIKILSDLTISDLERLYVEFHREAETHPEMEEEARKWFKKLEEGDEEAKKIWQACVEISLKEFNRIYDLLGVKIDYAYGESFYQDKMEEVLADCREKGILKESQGAQVVELEGMEIPAMLVKSDGATTYLLRDLATVKFRKREWHPDLFVYEVGADQSFHFQQLFKLCELLGYGQLKQFVHIGHGLIRWSTGKFSTRKGETIHLEEVLDEAIRRATVIPTKSRCTSGRMEESLSNETDLSKTVRSDYKSKIQGGMSDDPEFYFVGKSLGKTVGLSQEKGSFDSSARASSLRMTGDANQVAKAVGIGAIKYNDLKQNPKTDIIFDWEKILTLSGNSGPYLQYTYARTQSVLAKAKETENSEQGTVMSSRVDRKGIPPFRPDTCRDSSRNDDGFLSSRVERSEIEGSLSPNDISEEEISLLRTIYRFPEVIEEAAREFSPNLLCNFLFDLAQKFNLFYDKHRILPQKTEDGGQKTDGRGQIGTEPTEEQSKFRLLLTAAVGQVLKNGLTLLGIEALERM